MVLVVMCFSFPCIPESKLKSQYLLPLCLLVQWVGGQDFSSAVLTVETRQVGSELCRVFAPRALAPETLAHLEMLTAVVGRP